MQATAVFHALILLNVTESSVQFTAPSCWAVTLSLSILKPSVERKPQLRLQ